MTTKTLSHTYLAAGYTLSGAYSELDIQRTATISGTGVATIGFATIVNDGAIEAPTSVSGVYLAAGAAFTNRAGGDVDGGAGIAFNSGANIINLGTITGESNAGILDLNVVLDHTVSLSNGSNGNNRALLSGGAGVEASYGVIANFGTIRGVSASGVYLYDGGTVTNGSLTNTTARIEGATRGVGMQTTNPSQVANFGTIADTGSGHVVGPLYAGVYLRGGGVVTNGAATDTVALISGYAGVDLNLAGTIDNFGTIEGQGAHFSGVNLLSGTVVNGSNFDRGALIEGATGLFVSASAATVQNFGTIAGASGAAIFANGGSVTNGSATDAVAVIEGYSYGLVGVNAVTNLGAIVAVGAAGIGVQLANGALTNGSAGHNGALIEGYLGIQAIGAVTVANFGTIKSDGATALNFVSTYDVLIVEAGSAFVGKVLGGGGTLDLDTGVGTLSGFTGAAVTVSGSMAPASFQNFATVMIGAAAQFTDTGAVTILAGQTVNAAGGLSLGGPAAASVANAGLIETTGAGAITVNGAVTGKGHVTINGGTLDFTSGFNQAVTFAGTTGILELAQSQGYTASISGFSKSGKTSLDLVDIGFVSSAEATFSGNTTAGVLTVTDGAHTAHVNLKGNYTTSAWIASSDGHGGTLVIDPKPGAALNRPLPFIFAMAVLGGGAGCSVRSDALAPRPTELLAAGRCPPIA